MKASVRLNRHWRPRPGPADAYSRTATMLAAVVLTAATQNAPGTGAWYVIGSIVLLSEVIRANRQSKAPFLIIATLSLAAMTFDPPLTGTGIPAMAAAGACTATSCGWRAVSRNTGSERRT